MPQDSPNHPAKAASAAESRPTAHVLADLAELTADPVERAGARWTLSEPGRQLDANLIRLPAGHRVDTHLEPDLDVIVVVVAGSGTIGTPEGSRSIAEGAIAWLPRASTRSITAGPAGLSYLTVHRRRPGLQIRTRPTT
jgi:quercetin dioxygenase-like cupin family protein